MAMAKKSILMICTLLFSVLAVSASPSIFGPDECCFKFVSERLPKNKVMSFSRTNTMCPKAAVIFKMMNGREYCTDLSEQWVQNIIKAKTKVSTTKAGNPGSEPRASQSN